MFIRPVLSTNGPLFYDTFTDTNGTAITAHTPDIGTGWTHLDGSSSTSIQSNTIIGFGGSTAWACDSTSADCTITALTHNNAAQHIGGIIFRSTVSTSLANSWLLHPDDTQYVLYKITSGSFVSQDTDSSLGSNIGVTRDTRIVLSGSSIKCYVNDNLLFDITDSSYSTATYHGFRFFQTNAWIDNFKVVL